MTFKRRSAKLDKEGRIAGMPIMFFINADIPGSLLENVAENSGGMNDASDALLLRAF